MSRVQGQKHPLCAVYSTQALQVLRQELAAGRWKVTQAIESAGQVKFLDFDDTRWFANLNTPEEFAEAERHANAVDT